MYLIDSSFGSTINGSADDDVIDGAGGSDNLSGLAGDDQVYGGPGFDTLSGGIGNDLLYGEADDDLLKGGAGSDLLDGGLGYDKISYLESTAGVALDLISGGTTGDATGDTYVSIEEAEGSNFNDVIFGNEYATTFFDTGGSDRYVGRAGAADTYRAWADASRGVEIAFGARALQLAGEAGIALSEGTGIAVRTRSNGVKEYDVLQGMENFIGSPGADTINGDDRANVIDGREGNDTLNGGDGFDFADFFFAAAAVNVNLGTGVAVSGAFTDHLSNVEGVIGSGFNDSITGGAGAERLQGDSGNDVLNGAAGNDHLTGGTGTDALLGGAGDDLLSGGSEGDLMDGGSGNDWVTYENSPGGVYVDLLARNGLALVKDGITHTNGYSPGDRYISIENVTGSKKTDYLKGDNRGNTMEGLDGDDELYGCNGNDVLWGDYSPDHDSGIAPPVFPSATHDDEECMDCDIEHYADGSAPVGENLNSPSPASADWNDYISGGDGDDEVYGQAGSDVLLGDCGDDRLAGGAQIDLLFGGEDNDVLEGGAGFDILFGGSGADIASYETSSRSVKANLSEFWTNSGGDAASDLITELIGMVAADDSTESLFSNAIFAGLLSQLNDPAFDLARFFKVPDIYFSIEGLEGSRFDDVLTGSGGANILEGGGGNDTIDGRGGEDTASYAASRSSVTVSLLTGKSSGGAGVDTLKSIENLTGSLFADRLTGDGAANLIDGGRGADNLTGGDGNDTLAGGADADRLDGGAGNDILVWDAADTLISGGAGTDTLRASGSRVLVDLVALSNSKIESVEIINLAGSGNNALRLAPSDVFAINSAHTLRVDGDEHDTLEFAPTGGAAWRQRADQQIAGDTYLVFTQGQNTLLVDSNIELSTIVF